MQHWGEQSGEQLREQSGVFARRRSRVRRPGRWLGAAGGALLAAGIAAGCGAAEPERMPVRDYCEPDGIDGQPIECCRICAVGQDAPGVCDVALPPADWPDFSATWSEWRQGCDSEATVAAGRCSSGIRFVRQHWPPGAGETRYFDADGRFLALEGYVDVYSDTCGFEWYWPKRVECGQPMQELGCQAPPQLL
jgi:hypothetical protein